MSESFDMIERKLRAKRRRFNQELQSVLDVAESPDGLNKPDFLERKNLFRTYLERGCHNYTRVY